MAKSIFSELGFNYEGPDRELLVCELCGTVTVGDGFTDDNQCLVCDMLEAVCPAVFRQLIDLREAWVKTNGG